jgi:bifunctional non-homologous end joining protein LigD
MLYAFSLPTKANKVPTSPDWIHEIKYDGYRIMLIRDQDRVRLISSGGHDWVQHFPLIVAAALKLRQKQFVLDGEVVVLDKDGVSDFDALASRKHDNLAQFYAFDLLASDGEDFRPQALLLRKASLARLLKQRVDGIFIADYEQGGGDVLFRSALPAIWVSKASSQSASTAPMVPESATTGSRSRTLRTRLTSG